MAKSHQSRQYAWRKYAWKSCASRPFVFHELERRAMRNAGVAYVGGLHGHCRVREGSQAGAGGALANSACLVGSLNWFDGFEMILVTEWMNFDLWFDGFVTVCRWMISKFPPSQFRLWKRPRASWTPKSWKFKGLQRRNICWWSWDDLL